MMTSIIFFAVTKLVLASQPTVVEIPIQSYEQSVKFSKTLVAKCSNPSDRLDLTEPPQFTGDAACGKDLQKLAEIWKTTQSSQIAAVNISSHQRLELIEKSGLSAAPMVSIEACPCIVFTGKNAQISAKKLMRTMAKK